MKPLEGVRKKYRKLIVSLYQKINKGPFFVFLEVSGVSETFWCCPFLGSNLLVNLKDLYHKQLSEIFCLQDKILQGALLVLLNLSCTEELCVEGTINFSGVFLSNSNEFFFDVYELWLAHGIKTALASKENLPVETFWRKRDFAL